MRPSRTSPTHLRNSLGALLATLALPLCDRARTRLASPPTSARRVASSSGGPMDDVHGIGTPGTVGPRRLLAVIDWLEVGGAQRHLLGLAAGLRRDGCEVVVATSGQEPLTDAFRQAGIQVVSLTQRSIKHRFS